MYVKSIRWGYILDVHKYARGYSRSWEFVTAGQTLCSGQNDNSSCADLWPDHNKPSIVFLVNNTYADVMSFQSDGLLFNNDIVHEYLKKKYDHIIGAN